MGERRPAYKAPWLFSSQSSTPETHDEFHSFTNTVHKQQPFLYFNNYRGKSTGRTRTTAKRHCATTKPKVQIFSYVM